VKGERTECRLYVTAAESIVRLVLKLELQVTSLHSNLFIPHLEA